MAKLHAMTVQEVVVALRNALDLDGADLHDDFDKFVARPIQDPHLESLRKEFLDLVQSEGQPIRGRDFGSKAEEWLRRTLRQLQEF